MENWLTREWMDTLHNEIKSTIESYSNVDLERTSTYGVEVSRWTDTEFHSHFQVKGKEVEGFRDGQSFRVTYQVRDRKVQVFIPDVSYFFFDYPLTAKEVLDFVRDKTETTVLQ
jgi:hypothetical protein